MSFFSGTNVANPPVEVIDYRLCKEFGWTITELHEQPWQEVQKFIQIMNTRQEVLKAGQSNG